MSAEPAEAETSIPQGWEPNPRYQIESLLRQKVESEARHAEEQSRLESFIREQQDSMERFVARIAELEGQLANRAARRSAKKNSPTGNGRPSKKTRK